MFRYENLDGTVRAAKRSDETSKLSPVSAGLFQAPGRTENPRQVFTADLDHGLFQPVRVSPALCNRCCGQAFRRWLAGPSERAVASTLHPRLALSVFGKPHGSPRCGNQPPAAALSR